MPKHADRPDGYPLHADADLPAGNVTPVRESVYSQVGYAEESIIKSDDHNGKLQSGGRWTAYGDLNTLRNVDWLDLSIVKQLSANALSYTVGQDATASPGADVLTRTSLIVRGVRVETDNDTLTTLVEGNTFPWPADPLYVGDAPKPGRIWVYLRVPADPDLPLGIRAEGVAPGTADAAGAEETALAGVDVDVAGLITANVVPVTVPIEHCVPVQTPIAFQGGALATTFAAVGDVSLLADVTLGIESTDMISIFGTVEANEAVTVDGVFTTNGALVANASATVNAGLTVNNGTAEFNSPTFTVNSTTPSFANNAGFDEGLTVATAKALTLTGTASIVGGVGSVATVETVTPTSLLWASSGTTLPATIGETTFNDTFYAVRGGSGGGQVRTWADPIRGYDASHVTPNAIADTAAVVVRRIKHNEPVWVEMACRYEGTNALSNMQYRIQVTGPLGSADIILDTLKMTTANSGYSMDDGIQWTPTDSFGAELAIQDYTFRVRIGVSAGTITATRIRAKASSAVQV